MREGRSPRDGWTDGRAKSADRVPVPTAGESTVVVRPCVNVDGASPPREGGKPHALPPGGPPAPGFLIMIINICLYRCSFGRECRRKNQGFTHHEESLWHHIPLYKGSESAPPFGLIHERERKREGCDVATLLRASGEETGQQNSMLRRLSNQTNTPLYKSATQVCPGRTKWQTHLSPRRK